MRTWKGVATGLCMLACSRAISPTPAKMPEPQPRPAVAATGPVPAPAEPAPPALPLSIAAERALRIVRGLHAAPRETAYASFSERFRQAVTETELRETVAGIERKIGKLREVRVLDESGSDVLTTVYLAAFFERGTRSYRVSLSGAGVIEGLFVAPFADDSAKGKGPADEYVAKHRFTLPGRGVWSVSQGGPDPGGNQHIGNTQQWYAFDLVRVGADGRKTKSDGKESADYWAWGETVVAPADGTVVMVVNSVPDHEPNHRDAYFLAGNLIVIDHGEREFSFLAHLRLGSILVQKGQRVRRGQALAKVGNSGNSSGPHLHFHLATDADISRGHGLPIRFGPLRVNGQHVEEPLLKQGDSIEAVSE